MTAQPPSAFSDAATHQGHDENSDQNLARRPVRAGVGVSTGSSAAPSSALTPTTRSVLPVGRYKTKDLAGDRHPTDGRERQVSGHQRLACLRQLPQKTDPYADRLLGVV